MSNSHVLVRSLVHIQGGAKCICITCSGQMRDLNPFHILVQAKSACSHMPTLSRICPAFLQASTRQPLARMQEIVGRTNVMAIRFSLSAFTSPNNASFVHWMPQTFSQPTKVLLWKSSRPCGDLERVQFSDCLESKPFACPRVIGQNGAFALTTARFWPIMQGQANSSLSKSLEDRATVCGKAREFDPAASEKGWAKNSRPPCQYFTDHFKGPRSDYKSDSLETMLHHIDSAWWWQHENWKCALHSERKSGA